MDTPKLQFIKKILVWNGLSLKKISFQLTKKQLHNYSLYASFLSLKLINMKSNAFFLIKNFEIISDGGNFQIICIKPLLFVITIVYVSDF